MWVLTLEFFQLFSVFEHFYNNLLEKKVKAEWVAKTQRSEFGHLRSRRNRRARKVSSRVVLWSDLHFSIIPLPEVYRSSLQPFWHQGLALWKTSFPWTETGVETVWGCFKHIPLTEHHRLSFTSDRQALGSHEKCATESPRMRRSQ